MNGTSIREPQLTDGLSGDGSLDWRKVALARYRRLLADLGDPEAKMREAELLHTILVQAGEMDLPPVPWAATLTRRGPYKPKAVA